MKKYLTLTAGLLAGAALMLASPAMAGHVDVGVNIGLPGFLPAPVYVEPRPVYVEPRPVYVEPRAVYVEPRPVYVEREREGEWRERRWHARQWRERHGYRDHDDEYRGRGHGERHGHDD